MTPRSLTLPSLFLATVLAGAVGAQATFTLVPGGSGCTDITPDGSIVVGYGQDPVSGQYGAYYWRWKQDPTPTYIGGSSATGVSDDGSVITGNIDHPLTGQQVAGRWTQATGWQPLNQGGLSECGSISSSYDISGDGKRITGLGWYGCDGAAFLWDESGGFTQGLELLGNGHNRASAISADGSMIAGFAQGNFNRSPAVWDPALSPSTSGTVFDMNAQGEVHGLSDDGGVLLGEWDNAAATEIHAFYWPDWQNDPTGSKRVLFGSLNPGWNGQAVDMAELAPGSSVPSIIVGYDSQMLSAQAWVWTPASGIVDLKSLLTGLGVSGVPALGACTSITPNGRTITGHTSFGGAWIVDFPAPWSATVYGCGVNPAASMSVLSGSAQVGKTLTLGLDNPLGSQPAGSLPFVFLATLPSSQYPCGTSLPFTGMAGGAGELLIDVFPPNPILPALTGPVWTGPGSPAPVQLAFPLKATLVGKKLYAQGVLGDVTLTTIPIALTNAVEILIGG